MSEQSLDLKQMSLLNYHEFKVDMMKLLCMQVFRLQKDLLLQLDSLPVEMVEMILAQFDPTTVYPIPKFTPVCRMLKNRRLWVYRNSNSKRANRSFTTTCIHCKKKCKEMGFDHGYDDNPNGQMKEWNYMKYCSCVGVIYIVTKSISKSKRVVTLKIIYGIEYYLFAWVKILTIKKMQRWARKVLIQKRQEHAKQIRLWRFRNIPRASQNWLAALKTSSPPKEIMYWVNNPPEPKKPEPTRKQRRFINYRYPSEIYDYDDYYYEYYGEYYGDGV